jgi:hypothetical protein
MAVGVYGHREQSFGMMRFWTTGLIGFATLALTCGSVDASTSIVIAQAGPPTQIPPECERLTDPIQRAKCVEEKSKGKK